MNPMNETPASRPDPELILELIAEHIAANDRVVAAAERIGTTLPQEAERILREHRQMMANPPPPSPAKPVPSEWPAAQRYLEERMRTWGLTQLGVLILIGCMVLYFLLRR